VGVFGNNDGDPQLLRKKVTEKEGFEIRGIFAAITVEDRTLALLHGHEPDLRDALLRGGAFDLIVYGHSHIRVAVRNGKTLVVNPGEVCGYLTGIPTIALYDTGKGEAEFVVLS
jgi:Predicted phosphoesterase